MLAACLRASGEDAESRRIVAGLRRDYDGLGGAEFAGWFPYHRTDIGTPVLDTFRHFGWR